MNKMNERLTVFMISEIERLKEEGREPARRIYHNMLRTLRESAGKEEIGFEEVVRCFWTSMNIGCWENG